MKVVTFDLETRDADELYLRPDFVRIGGYKINDEPARVTEDIGELVSVLDDADLLMGHNITMFDLPALNVHHGFDAGRFIREGRVRDTLVMARQKFPPVQMGDRRGLDDVAKLLGVEGKMKVGGVSALRELSKRFGGYDKIPTDNVTYRRYLEQDVETSFRVAKLLPVDEYCIRETKYLWRLTAISRYGVRVDMDEMARQQASVERREREALEELHRRFGTPPFGSSKSPLATSAGRDRIHEILENRGVTRILTDKGALSTGKDALDAYMAEFPDDEGFVEFCSLVKTASGLRRPPAKYVRSDGKFHPSLSAAQRTGRISVTNPGLTVMGKRSRKDALDRAIILPDNDDEVLLCVDLSQVDARAVAAYTQDANYMAAFEPGKDQHVEMAKMIFGDPSRRNDAKMFTHAINYGMGAKSLSEKSGMAIDEVQGLLRRLDEAFPQLMAERRRVTNTATGVVTTPYGRNVGYDVRKAHTQAFASLGQGTARDLMAEGILRLPPHLVDCLRLIVHDEIVLSVPRDRFEDVKRQVLRALQFEFVVREGAVPVKILAQASGPGRDWADCYADEHPDWPEMNRAWREANRDQTAA